MRRKRKRSIGFIVRKLEKAGVEIKRMEWIGNRLDMDFEPVEIGLTVLKKIGWLDNNKVG